jgi:hypothetical protein
LFRGPSSDATWRKLPIPIASSSPWSIYRTIALLFKHFGVIDVMTAQSVAPRRTIMTNFTIDSDNNITAFGSAEEAAAATTTPFDTFASQKELAALAAAWPAERLVAIWNSLPGVKTAQVVAMLQRKNGATLAEIMDKMGWQKHTVRGFMAGTMKKAGYTVESFKPEGGERTYRINP